MNKWILSLLFISINSYGFTLNTNTGSSFSGDSVKVFISSNSLCDQTGMTREQILDLAMEGAQRLWNRVETANIEIKRGGILQTDNSLFISGELCAEDSNTNCDPNTTVPALGDIVIACNDNASNFPQTNLLALSAPIRTTNNEIKNSIILINNISGSNFSNLSYSEVRSVLAHEIGHALGIGHSQEDHALMYFQNATTLKRLSQDDKDALTYLYPNKLNDCANFIGTIEDDNHMSGHLISVTYGLIFCLLFLFMYKKITHAVINYRQS